MASVPAPPSEERPADARDIECLLGRVVLERVGEGGFGALYKVRHSATGRIEAVKVLKRELAQTPLFLERFRREAVALSLLVHPNVTRIYETGEVGGLCYIAMEYVRGTTLASRLKERPPPAWELLAVARDMARALAHAHEQGVIHRDVKPGNSGPPPP